MPKTSPKISPKTNNDQFGAAMALALVIGSMIGSGIFLIPISLAPLGWNAVFAWIICGAGAICLSMALADVSHTGDGIQAGVARILGPTPGFLAGWAYWTSSIASNAAVAVAAAATLSRLGLGHDLWLAPGFILLFTGINIAATRAAGSMQLITVAIKLLPIIAVIVMAVSLLSGGFLAGFSGGPTSNPHALSPSPINIANIATAVGLTVFALLGFENLTNLVGKVRDPARNLPRAIVGGTSLVALLYLLSSSAVSLLLSPAKTAASSSPYVDAISQSLGPLLGGLALFCVAISSLGTLSGGLLATGEAGYSMGFARDLPSLFALRRAGNIPYASHIISAALSIILVMANSSRSLVGLFVFAILLTSAGNMFFYIIGSVAAWKQSRGVKSRITIAAAMLFSLFALYGIGLEADLWGLAAMIFGLGLRWFMRRSLVGK